MPGFTSPDNLIYPVVGDNASPRVAIQQLADSTQTALNGITQDTGWVEITSVVTLDSGLTWSSGGGIWCRRVGPMVQLLMSFATTNAAGWVNIPTNGDVGDTGILSGIPSQFRPSFTGKSTAMSNGPQGRTNSYHLSNAGVLYLNAVQPDVTQTGSVAMPAGFSLACGGTYFGV